MVVLVLVTVVVVVVVLTGCSDDNNGGNAGDADGSGGGGGDDNGRDDASGVSGGGGSSACPCFAVTPNSHILELEKGSLRPDCMSGDRGGENPVFESLWHQGCRTSISHSEAWKQLSI